VSKSVTVTFCLALAKVERGVPSWLMAAAMTVAEARALVKSMVAACSVPSAFLHRCSLVS
jgi:hypothetical protein